MKRSRRFWLAVGAILVVICGIAIYFFAIKETPTNSGEKPSWLKRAESQQSQTQGLNRETAGDYITSGANYEDLKDYEKALEAYQKADTLLNEEQRTSGYNVYAPMARVYAKTGDNDKAREYFQRAIDSLLNGPYADDSQKQLASLREQQAAL